MTTIGSTAWSARPLAAPTGFASLRRPDRFASGASRGRRVDVWLRPRGNRHGAGEEAREAESEALGTAAAKEITSTDRYGAAGIGASLTQTLKKPLSPTGLGAVSVVVPVAGADAPGHLNASRLAADAAA